MYDLCDSNICIAKNNYFWELKHFHEPYWHSFKNLQTGPIFEIMIFIINLLTLLAVWIKNVAILCTLKITFLFS